MDRRADHRMEALRRGGFRILRRHHRPVIDTCGALRLHHLRCDALPAAGECAVPTEVRFRCRAEEGHGLVRVAAADVDPWHPQGLAGLSRDCVEDRARRGLLGHQRRDSAQGRALLLSQAAKFVACLRIRYRAGHEMGVVGQSHLASWRQDLIGFAVGGDVTPDRTIDNDRRGNGLAEPFRPVLGREFSGNFGPIIDSRRLASPDRQDSFRAFLNGPGSSVRHRGPGTVRPEDLGKHLRIRVVADQADCAYPEQPRRLDRYRSEYRLRFCALRGKSRDPPQCALGLRQAAQFLVHLPARYCTGHQLAEVGKPRRRPGGEGFGGWPKRRPGRPT